MTQIFVNGFYDDYDEMAFHWAVFDDNENFIASARLTNHSSLDTLPDNHLLADISELNMEFQIASLNRLAVGKAYQGQGIVLF